MTTNNTTSHTPPPHPSPLAPDASAGVFCLDSSYATTRLVTQEIPAVEDLPDAAFKSMLFLPPNPERKGEGGLRTQGYFKKSLPDKPLITVITVVFNGEKHLEDTIKSVINQTYDNVEYIIIDGGSTDGTVDIIKEYENQIDYWICEKDRGIYDAMNNGISLARGVMTNLLNSDDYYYGFEILTEVMNSLISENSMYVAETMMVANGKNTVFGHTKSISRLYYQIPFMHPSCFIQTELYRNHGLYSLSYKIASDVDFIMGLIYSGVRIIKLPFIAVGMRHGGASNRSFISGRLEYARIYFNHTHNLGIALYGLSKSVLFFYLSRAKGALLNG